MSAHDDWLEFLQKQANYTHASTVAASRELAQGKTVFCDLSGSGLIAASGEEAESFLQNQFCNDVRLVSETHSQLNGYCTAKGRLLALFHLFKHNGIYYCDLPRERLAPTLKRLQMYVLMSRVKLQDASDELIRIGLAGQQAQQVLQSISTTIPMQVNDAIQHQGVTIMRMPASLSQTELPRFLLIGTLESIKPVWQALCDSATADVVAADAGIWQYLDILAGIPQVVESTVEEFVPQMVNLQSINGLSFKKGCYPGQEVVARMHYLGKQKKRMYLAHLDSASVPQPGTAIYMSGEHNNQAIGQIVSSCAAPSGGADILAVLQIASAQSREVHLGDQQNIPFHLKDLPYSVEVEGDGQ